MPDADPADNAIVFLLGSAYKKLKRTYKGGRNQINVKQLADGTFSIEFAHRQLSYGIFNGVAGAMWVPCEPAVNVPGLP